MTKYGIVGDGRVARHTAHYLDLSGLPYTTWSRREERATSTPVGASLASCDVVLVLISDAAIEPFIEDHSDLRDKTLVHFSGSLVTPLARGMHPLSSFAADLYDLGTYQAIPFVCDEGAPGFGDVFPELSNPHYTIAGELKPLYHCMAVLAGNFTTVLWNKLFDTFEERLQLPKEVATPYLRQIASNLEHAPTTAQTGPLARNDRQTIHANLEALGTDPYRDVYAAFVRAVAPELLEGSS
jgi:predicted short-subunit dehydrogenase-like oxidoreductase (DUF2520 family)